MNIVITGGLGYVGGRVAHYIRNREKGARLFLTTRKVHDRLPAWTREFTIFEMDLLDGGSIARCLKANTLDAIVHLAALNEIESMAEPELALNVNAGGTYRLLTLARKNGIRNFLYLSTFHVYGDCSASPITEATPTRPSHPYAVTHLAAEGFVDFFRRYHGMNTLILRLSNAYGYPMHAGVNRWSLVFNDLCRQAVTNGKLVLKTSGTQCRDFVSLHNVARAVHHFLFGMRGQWNDGLYNLGGNCTLSIRDAAQLVADVYERKYERPIAEISVPASRANTSGYQESFTYSIEKIQNTGFCLEGDMTGEIEKTLAVCEAFVR